MDLQKPEVDLSLLPDATNLVLMTYRGSVAHGMYIPPEDPNSIDDVDVVGVAVPDDEHYLGLKRFGHNGNGTRETFVGNLDAVVYEFQKTVRLLLKGNPNIMSMLWVEKEHVLLSTDTGMELIWNRHWFAGKHCYQPIAGYAAGQLSKMTHTAFQGYMGAKRKKLVERFGYDTKNAAHLLRLLTMGREFLDTGCLQVFRTDDAQTFLDVKIGKWSKEHVLQAAEDLFNDLRKARDRSPLPNEPDYDRVNSWCANVLREHFYA